MDGVKYVGADEIVFAIAFHFHKLLLVHLT